MKRAIFILALLLLAAEVRASHTIYVGTSGNDGNACKTAESSISTNRKRTIREGLACIGSAGTTAGAGHTVEVAAGTYTENLIDRIPSGTSGNVFTLRCESTGLLTCILQPNSATASGYAIEVGSTGLHYAIISGFKTNAGTGYFTTSGTTPTSSTNIVIENFEVDGAAMNGNAMGIQSSNSSSITVRSCTIHSLIGGTGGFTGLAHGIYAADGTVNWIIEKCTVRNNGAYGIHSYGTGSTQPTGFKVRRNITHSNVAAGIIMYGEGHEISYNVSYSNFGGILMRSGNGLLYNNTVYLNTEGGIYNDYNIGLDYVCRNNLAISNGSGNVRNCNTVSHSVTTGTAASHFVNAGAGDFTLLSTSGALNQGTATIYGSTVVAYNGGAPDAGAHQKLGAITCEVGLVAANILACDVQNNVNPPLLPAASITGITVTRAGASNAVTANSRQGTNGFRATLTDNFTAGQECKFIYSQSTGNITDSALIGNTSNQELFTTVELLGQTCTNNVSGPATATVTQSHAAMFAWAGDEGSGAQIGSTNSTTALRAMVHAKYLARLALKTTVADTAATNYALRYSKNGGAYAVVPTFTGSEDVGICDATSVSAGNTTQRITSGAFEAGRVVEVGAGIPTITMTSGESTELLYPICYGPNLVAGTDNIKFRVYKDDGTALAYDTNATLNVDVVSPSLAGL